MKKLKYEARGVTAAVIESKITPTGDAALDGFLEKAEAAFLSGAEAHALARRDEAEKMSARERRHLSPMKTTLSCVSDGAPIARVTLTATLVSDGETREKTSSFFYDASSSLMSKTAKTRKNKTSHEKL